MLNYITEQRIRERYSAEYRRRTMSSRTFSAREILNEGVQTSDSTQTFDIFLSHSSSDNQLTAGLKLILEDLGFSVYVDWTDPALNPQNVTPQTAAILRDRMSHCKSLLYAFSDNSTDSHWMPWELGYFDGLRNSMVAVLPISSVNSKTIEGSEYVGLYYVIDFDTIKGSSKDAFWVNNGSDYVNLKDWIQGKKPYKHS